MVEQIGKSVFIKTFGDSPIHKVLDFLVVFSEFDYSIADISKKAKVGYSTLKILIKKLEKLGLVKHTRIDGRNKMYKLNRTNQSIITFEKFYWDITKIQNDKTSISPNRKNNL